MIMIEQNLRSILSVLLVLVGLLVGLILRSLLVRRLKKTVLDAWLVQVLGLILALLPLLAAAAGLVGILTNGLNQFWQTLSSATGIKSQDIYNLIKDVVLSLLIIVFAIGGARTLSRLTLRGLGNNRLALNMRIVINRITDILVLMVATFWILSLWQVSIELPVAVLGALTVAVSFSIQDILKDLVAGLYILLERPFFIGDQISTDSHTGQVEAVELRATRLRLVSGEEVTLPNSLIFSGIIINNSRYAERRATIVITLPLEDFSREETPKNILGSLHELTDVLAKPEPTISVSGIINENVELTLRFWVATGQLATVTDVVYALRTPLPHANLAVKDTAGDI